MEFIKRNKNWIIFGIVALAAVGSLFSDDEAKEEQSDKPAKKQAVESNDQPETDNDSPSEDVVEKEPRVLKLTTEEETENCLLGLWIRPETNPTEVWEFKDDGSFVNQIDIPKNSAEYIRGEAEWKRDGLEDFYGYGYEQVAYWNYTGKWSISATGRVALTYEMKYPVDEYNFSLPPNHTIDVFSCEEMNMAAYEYFKFVEEEEE